MIAIASQQDIEPVIRQAHRNIVPHTQIEKWTREGSGWAVSRVVCLYVNISKYAPLKVSSYIDLPKSLKDKKAIANVQNTDQQCLKWAFLSFLNPARKDAQRVTKYIAHQDELDFTGIEFPTPPNQIPSVEHLNNYLRVWLFGRSRCSPTLPDERPDPRSDQPASHYQGWRWKNECTLLLD